MELANMAKNANSLTECQNYALSLATLNTKQICAALTIPLVFALMDPGVTLSIIWRKPPKNKKGNKKLTKLPLGVVVEVLRTKSKVQTNH